ncbi:sodium:solute symporter [Neptunomonas sp. XY-337]|uniref:sodium:solute symporter family protein n=1 Tax=Neptunomonas sp. XY-337 TaxID=2561897 RepID=UPI0010A9F72B|nr:sodium:solute symporter [Neptunomonas sp. XY-337]
MFSPLVVVSTILIYMACLFGIAQLVERRVAATGETFKSPWIYALSLAIYHTSWTFYGSVGFASTSGLLFLGIYVGALIGIALWWVILRKMVIAKEVFRITSVADFLSTRYRRSQKIAGLVTLIALTGLLPYIALQLKAFISSFEIITQRSSDQWSYSGLLVTLLMTLFTILFGAKRLDPTERHQGMVVVMVVESMVKIVAVFSVGLFVLYGLYDGIGDLNARIAEAELTHLTSASATEHSFSMWVTLIILSFSGIYLLPRQFHMSVVENTDQHHIKTAMWVFPLYMIAINLFVIPIAAAGLLGDFSDHQADYFALLLPQEAGQSALTMLVFIGGFSASTAMIIVTTVTLATMVSNHWVLPTIERFSKAQGLRPYLLQMRWALVALILASAYWFEHELSDSYILVAIGLLSFVAVLQFAPAVFGGLFWPRGNSAGAFAGLLAGFGIWVYTLAIPTFIKNGWLDPNILLAGPWGIELLRPEALFGLDGFHPIAHSVIWSLSFNLIFYIVGSLIYQPHKDERTFTTEFMSVLTPVRKPAKARPTGLDSYIPLSAKLEESQHLLAQYLSDDKSRDAIFTICEDLQVAGKTHITIIELMEFHRMVEHILAGSIGAASAHRAMEQNIRYSTRESSDLKALYSHIVSELKGGPSSTAGSMLTTDTSALEQHGLIGELQSSINKLELKNQEYLTRLARLEEKLEKRDHDIFKYRMEAQRKERDNKDLLLVLEDMKQKLLAQREE